jgi:hypothetical protein
MLTGRKAFDSDTPAGVISGIMSRTPAPMSMVREVPPALDRLVAVCLARDPDDRWQTARDLVRELRWIAAGGDATAAERPRPARFDRGRWIGWGLAAVLATVTLVLSFRPGPAALPELRLDIVTPPTDDPVSLAVSPDGRQLVYAARSQDASGLWLRRLDSTDARFLADRNATRQDSRGRPLSAPPG